MPGKRSFDYTDDEEVPEIILHENDSDEGDRRKRGGGSSIRGKPRRRTCCNPIIIIGLVIVILAIVGLLLFFFLFKPDDSNQGGGTKENQNSLPGSEPASVDVLERLCSNNNGKDMQRIFSTGEELYMVEFFNFQNQAERDTFDEYRTLLSDLGSDVEMVQEIKIESWEMIMVMKYRNAAVFRQSVLENPDMESMLEQRKRIQNSQMIATSLNMDVPNMYPKLVKQPGNPEYIFFHALKFQAGTGRQNVAIFDSDTEGIKGSFGIFSQAWLDVQAACIGQNDEVDQFRIESVRSVAEYGKILMEDGWTEAQEYRAAGIKISDSYSQISDEFEMVTNLYL